MCVKGEVALNEKKGDEKSADDMWERNFSSKKKRKMINYALKIFR